MKLSVAICTRNPRPDYLERVFHALAVQTLPRSEWELLLIDSASDQPLLAGLACHLGLAYRLGRLAESGILRARCTAIAHAIAPVLLFLDDDNVPAPDYLARGLELGAQYPMLGCWGPARILPECETPPPPQIAGQLKRMACCDFPADRWSNTLDVVPPAAGLFLRLAPARAYAAFAERDPRRRAVGETAECFFRGEDTDLVFFIVKQGLGAGQFRALSMIHLMPNRRLTEDYIVLLSKVAAGSALLINHLWEVAPPRESRLDRMVYRLKALRFRGLTRRIARAHRQGEAEALALIKVLKS
jgi:glycosyltransferase involved in cell wall biosynthesis